MSGELLPRSGGEGRLLPTRLNRELARVEERAMVRAHKVQAINFVGTAALHAVTQLSMTQTELTKVVPDAALRLAAIADAATATIQAAVMQMAFDP
jgi:hypothetical protein